MRCRHIVFRRFTFLGNFFYRLFRRSFVHTEICIGRFFEQTTKRSFFGKSCHFNGLYIRQSCRIGRCFCRLFIHTKVCICGLFEQATKRVFFCSRFFKFEIGIISGRFCSRFFRKVIFSKNGREGIIDVCLSFFSFRRFRNLRRFLNNRLFFNLWRFFNHQRFFGLRRFI